MQYKRGNDVKKMSAVIIILLVLTCSNLLFAGKADVLAVKVKKTGKNSYHFKVTVRHKDTGWEHYVNRWEILDSQGKILATRVLMHPHVKNQPFTRSLSKVKIPVNVYEVIVRAYDKVHGYGGAEKKVKLPGRSKKK